MSGSHLTFSGEYSRLVWTEVVSDRCSYCSADIDEDAVPLRLFRSDGKGAVLCDECVHCYVRFARDQ
jgi:hypothetical protein